MNKPSSFASTLGESFYRLKVETVEEFTGFATTELSSWCASHNNATYEDATAFNDVFFDTDVHYERVQVSSDYYSQFEYVDPIVFHHVIDAHDDDDNVNYNNIATPPVRPAATDFD